LRDSPAGGAPPCAGIGIAESRVGPGKARASGLGGSFVRTRLSLLSTTLAVAALLLSSTARADLIGPYTMTFSVDGLGVVGTVNGYHDDDYGDTGYYDLDDVTLGGVAFVDYWNSSYDIDPFVTNNFSVTNISAFPQVFDILVTSPVLATGPQTDMTGSVGLTITNTASASASLGDAGVAVYQAMIDGVTVETIFDPAYTLSCGAPFCSNTDNDGFVSVTGPAAASSISIRIRFTLSPGDSASGTSVFNIEAIPEPTTAILLGLGLTGIAAAGRRRA
jgi:hypothetical protein